MKLNSSYSCADVPSMQSDQSQFGEKQGWKSAFLALLIISALMLSLRLSGAAFLILEFEFSLIYLPTILAGLLFLRVRN